MKMILSLNKVSLLTSLIILLLSVAPLHGASNFHPYTIKLKNSLHSERYDERVMVPLSDLKNHIKDFDENNCVIKLNGKNIPFDLVKDNYNKVNLVFQLNFKPDELKLVTLSYSAKKPVFHNNRTRAYLGVKKNYAVKEGVYTGGNFESTDHAVVPKSHFPHDALYQMEGPAWESDKVAYRFYLDERNRTDIFGKSTNKMVLDIVGKNDLLSGDESYEYPLWWGQDIFKVGTSLGIGSVASFMNDKVCTVSETDSIRCAVFNYNVHSSVVSDHIGWKVDNNKFNISINYSIYPGSRLTEVNVKTDKPIENLCTGLAKHDSTSTLFSKNNDGWNYVAIWGKQTICNDNLGIVLFYNSKDLIKLTEDKISQIVLLKPLGNCVKYFFAAAWEKEKNGVKTQKSFLQFLNSTIEALNNPIIVAL
ncbi:MAG: DUF4861 family protein [Ignavibacteriaceae bacterium]|nr:DUF4861 family protein [Ignavibacteriaceae bacterium]